ncbi:MAG TPA: phospholipase D-like domain-containing protein [Geobacteraceae bacterium]|nr:phospholipase D-like domain-containing protein [Geobacteraceae bacterium]
MNLSYPDGGALHQFLYFIVFAFVVSLSLVSACHALLFKRDPRAALGWILACLTLPLLGPVLYWSAGINRIRLRARQWLDSGRRLAGWDSFPAGRLPAAVQDIPGAEHINELRKLADRVVSKPLVGGNRVTPLANGENAYPAMLAAIDDARRSINLSTYIFDGDGTGRRFVEALKGAAERGVEVRVIIDALGEKYSFPTARRLLKGSRVRVGRFLPLRQGWYLNLRNHRKILVADGFKGFTGGMNIGDRHLVEAGANRRPVADLHFMVEGPVVADLQRVFLEDWYFATGELVQEGLLFPELFPCGSSLARAIGDGPEKEFRKLHCIIIGALSCARERVRIMTPYFIPDRALISALVTTALRGVEVTLVLPSLNNLPYVHWATRAYLWEVLQHGIRVFYQPPPFVHTKLFLVDGVWGLIGSANLDPRSLRLNFELNMELYDREFVERLERQFDGTVAASRGVTLEEMDGRPLAERIRDGVAKLMSPYM